MKLNISEDLACHPSLHAILIRFNREFFVALVDHDGLSVTLQMVGKSGASQLKRRLDGGVGGALENKFTFRIARLIKGNCAA
jgi:hypothetical protein